MKKLLSLALIAGSLTACNTTSTGDPYQSAWFDVFGNPCYNMSPRPGCNYYSYGAKIRIYQDPFYYGGITFTYGYWQSPTGIIYSEYGYAINEQNENTEVSADVIAQAAIQEKEITLKAGKDFAQKYALATDQGVAISKTLQAWALLAHDRARTDSDISEFAKRLYGVSLNQVKKAMTEAAASQSKQPLEELNVEVAAHWGTTPEVSKQILRRWYKDEVSAD